MTSMENRTRVARMVAQWLAHYATAETLSTEILFMNDLLAGTIVPRNAGFCQRAERPTTLMSFGFFNNFNEDLRSSMVQPKLE